ncbi:hypothetical protein CDCA_CDCA20G4769 [Cyanidium caldarium]|uniref:Uncharacterized protein n=1 Tax=Cyanidium caldarium TaxID=2771 RepID=A0AAV9J345_CYACA|nr:hypothetical protein CDCA_CDCA20G4769 [Cyanidium caldarium]
MAGTEDRSQPVWWRQALAEMERLRSAAAAAAANDDDDEWPAADASTAAQCRALCKLFYDHAAGSPARGEEAPQRPWSVGPLSRLTVDGLDAEQIWQELVLRHGALLDSAKQWLTSRPPAKTLQRPSKRVRFSERLQETREFERDSDEEVGCVLPSFLLEEDWEELSGEYSDEDEEEWEEEDRHAAPGPRHRLQNGVADRENVDDGEGAASASEEEDAAVGGPSELDDEFFCEDEVDDAIEEMEREIDAEPAVSEDGMPSEEDDDDEVGDAPIYYRDFFDPPRARRSHRPTTSSAAKHQEERPESESSSDASDLSDAEPPADAQEEPQRLKLRGLLDREPPSGSSEGDGADDRTPFQRAREEAGRRAAELETFNVSDKPWTLRGEVTAAERPINSLLDAELEHDASAARRPRHRLVHGAEADAATEAEGDGNANDEAPLAEDTAALERRIRQRVAERAFDDVERRVRPDLQTSAADIARRQAQLRASQVSQEKSRIGLAEVYQAEREQPRGAAPATAGLDREHQGTEQLFVKLCRQLDALSHHVYTPVAEPTDTQAAPPRVPQDTVQLEEAAPTQLSASTITASVQAPQEVYRPPGGQALSATASAADSVPVRRSDAERTRSERRTLRNRLKRRQRKLQTQREAQQQRRRQALAWMRDQQVAESARQLAQMPKRYGRAAERSAAGQQLDQHEQHHRTLVEEQARYRDAEQRVDAERRIATGQVSGVRVRRGTDRSAAERKRRRPGDNAWDDGVNAGGGTGSRALYQQLQQQVRASLPSEKK